MLAYSSRPSEKPGLETHLAVTCFAALGMGLNLSESLHRL